MADSFDDDDAQGPAPEPARKKKLDMRKFAADEASDEAMDASTDGESTGDEEEEDTGDTDTGEVNSFINDDDEIDDGDRGVYRNVDESAFQQTNVRTHRPPPMYSGPALGDGLPSVRLQESDYPVYKVPIKKSKQVACLLSMAYRLRLNSMAMNPGAGGAAGADAGAPSEYARRAAFRPAEYDVKTVTASPHDPEYIYVEANSLQTVERFCGLFGAFLGRFTPVTIVKRARAHKKGRLPPPPLTRVEDTDRPTLLTYRPSRLLAVQVNTFYKIRAGSRVYRGDVCRVVDVRDDSCTVVVEPRIQSLDSAGPSHLYQPRRLTYEEMLHYMHDGFDYQKAEDHFFPSGARVTLREGLHVLHDVRASSLQKLTNREVLELEARKGFLALSSETLDEGARRQEVLGEQGRRMALAQIKKLPLTRGDRVNIINEVDESGRDLTGVLAEVADVPANSLTSDVYTVRFLSKQYRSRPDRLVARKNLIKDLEIGDHVKIMSELYQGVTGRIMAITSSVEDGFSYITLETDIFRDTVGYSDEAAAGPAAGGALGAASANRQNVFDLTTDEVAKTLDIWPGLPSVSYGGMDLNTGQNNRFSLVTIAATNMTGVVCHLSHTSAVILTMDDEVRKYAFTEFSLAKTVGREFGKDAMGRTIARMSTVRVAQTDNPDLQDVVGDVVAVVGSKIIVKPTVDRYRRLTRLFAIECRCCNLVLAGRVIQSYIQRNTSNGDIAIGRRVVVKDPRFPGKEGTLIGINSRNQGRVQMKDRAEWVPLHLLVSKESTEDVRREIKHEPVLGAIDYPSERPAHEADSYGRDQGGAADDNPFDDMDSYPAAGSRDAPQGLQGAQASQAPQAYGDRYMPDVFAEDAGFEDDGGFEND